MQELKKAWKKGPTLDEFFTIGFPDELSMQSSNGGGNTFPACRCILFAAPVICWTWLLQNNKASD